MRIALSRNALCSIEQEIEFEKVTVLIGENGAGKSSILLSIFNDKLNDRLELQDKKIVCFSSGQNEKFSTFFSAYLLRERRVNRGLNLECCYYDKSWSSLLIFIATMTKSGFVRKFLELNEYVDQSEDLSKDISSTLKISIHVERAYINRIADALKEEEAGESNTLRTSDYHRTLESFIRSIVDNNYDFEDILSAREISLNHENLYDIAFIATEDSFFAPVITFFTQAADNNYFLDRESMKLFFKDELSLDDLSDGEYQLLFIYALLDLFDSQNTLFLLDEVDSHLHYENVEKLWQTLHSIEGKTLTTTHLVDSITDPRNTFNHLKIVKRGGINEEDKVSVILDRLSVLSRMKSTGFEVCCKLENLVLIDDWHDWVIFLALAKQLSLDVSILSKVQVLKKTSSYGSINETFGKAKLDWVDSLLLSESDKRIKNIFLICDRDNAALSFHSDGVRVTGKQPHLSKIREKNKNIGIYLLSWSRREVKNYLMSYTGLSAFNVLDRINNEAIAIRDHLRRGDPADTNDAVKRLDVKAIISDLIDSPGHGLDQDKLNAYVREIPTTEISEDIKNMYNFIVGKLA